MNQNGDKILEEATNQIHTFNISTNTNMNNKDYIINHPENFIKNSFENFIVGKTVIL